MLSRLISHLLIGFYISNNFFLLNFDHCDMYMVCAIFSAMIKGTSIFLRDVGILAARRACN